MDPVAMVTTPYPTITQKPYQQRCKTNLLGATWTIFRIPQPNIKSKVSKWNCNYIIQYWFVQDQFPNNFQQHNTGAKYQDLFWENHGYWPCKKSGDSIELFLPEYSSFNTRVQSNIGICSVFSPCNIPDKDNFIMKCNILHSQYSGWSSFVKCDTLHSIKSESLESIDSVSPNRHCHMLHIVLAMTLILFIGSHLSPINQHWIRSFNADEQWPLLVTWIKFNPSMDNQSYAQKSVEWNYLSIPKLQRLHPWSLGMDK